MTLLTPKRATGLFVAGAGALLLAGGGVGPVTVGGTAVGTDLLALVVLSAGFVVGGLLYLRQDDRTLGYAYVAGGVGWVFVGVGRAAAVDPLLLLGVLVLAGASALFIESWS